MAQVKGTLINAWKNFLVDRYGEDKLTAAIQLLDTGDRFYLQSPTLDSSWYPVKCQNILGKVTKSLATPADKDVATELGRYMADYVYAKVYRGLLKKAPNNRRAIDWFDDVVFRDLRKCEVEMSGPSSCIARYRYLEGKPTVGQCRSLTAFIARKLELAGYRNVTCVHTRCLATGGESCDFLMRWDD